MCNSPITRDEADFISKIVKEVAEKLDQPYLNVTDFPVGIEYHVRNLKSLLSLETDDIQIVAIWGVGGIGKTTIAKALFNNIYRSFEGHSCFLADVGTDTMQTLQERLISSILKQNMPKIEDFHRGIEVIKQKVWCRKVLLVLDDVNDINQLESLAINRSYSLPKGSKIIITTRDSFCVSSVDAKLYEPRPLSDRDSLSLFKWHAFGLEYPNQVYKELSMKVVDYAGGLPLVLKMLGSYMRILRTTDEWQEALERLRVIPLDDVQPKLMLSFGSLRGREKELFLDIAFFFIGMDKEFVFQVLDERTFEHYPKFEFKVLCNRCLVKTDGYGKLSMHNMIRDMGREIVRQESLNPERRSRLWHPNDVFLVLKESLGTEAIECIILSSEYPDEEPVDVNALMKMSNLRMIHFRHLKLHGTCNGTQSLDKLIWLSWYEFPLTCIPPNLDMQNLVVLGLPKSNLRQLWKGPKVFRKLRFLDLSDSYFLTSTPDFSGVINLERLWLRNCTNLAEIHQTIKCLDKLVFLDLQNCKRLAKVPSGILQLKSLKDANLFGCSRLFEAPSAELPFCSLCHLFTSVLFWKSMSKSQELAFLLTSSEQRHSCLKKLRLENCNLTNVPIEIGNLVSLEELYLSGNRISSLPASIRDLHRLQVLEVKDCFELKIIEDLPTNDFLLVRAEGSLSLETVQITSERFTEAQIFVSNGTKLLNNIFGNKEHGHALSKIKVLVGTDEIPHWFNYQGLGRFISFVAPKHDGRNIRGWVVGVSAMSYFYIFSYMLVYIYNKTKHKMHTVFVGLSGANNLLISYIQFSKYGIVVDGGDEIEILFMGTAMVQKCGLRLVNHGDEDLEVDKHLVIQYSPPATCGFDDDAYMINMLKQGKLKENVFDFITDTIANLIGPDLRHTLNKNSEVYLKGVPGVNMLAAPSECSKQEAVFGFSNNSFPSLHHIMVLASEASVMETHREFFKPLFGLLKEFMAAGIYKDAFFWFLNEILKIVCAQTGEGSAFDAIKKKLACDPEFEDFLSENQGWLEEMWYSQVNSVIKYSLEGIEAMFQNVEEASMRDDLEGIFMALSPVFRGLREVATSTDMAMMESYVSNAMMGSVKPVLHDLTYFDEKALLQLLKELAEAGGGGIHKTSSNEDRQAYHVVANAVYTNYMKSSTSNPSAFLELMEKSINRSPWEWEPVTAYS